MKSALPLIGNELNQNFELSPCDPALRGHEAFVPQLILNGWVTHTAAHN